MCERGCNTYMGARTRALSRTSLCQYEDQVLFTGYIYLQNIWLKFRTNTQCCYLSGRFSTNAYPLSSTVLPASRSHTPPPGLRKHLINKSLQLSLSLSLSRFHKTLLDKTQSPVTSFTEKLSAIPNTTLCPSVRRSVRPSVRGSRVSRKLRIQIN